QNAGDHAAHFVGRRAGFARASIGLISRRLAAASGEDFRAADQDAGIDTESIREKPEHDDGADAKAAAAERQAHAATAAAHHAAIITATVFNIVAAAKIVVTHGSFPSLTSLGARPRTKQLKSATR